MKFSEWLQPDTVAILDTAIYYGIPAYGHVNCYKQMEPTGHAPVRVTMSEPEIERKHCSGCGKLLIPRSGSEARR